MFLDQLEKVRQQPIEARRRFALVWSIIITIVIILVWISVIFGRSYALREPEPEMRADQPITEILPENLRSIFNDANSFVNSDELGNDVEVETPISTISDSLATSTDVLDIDKPATSTTDVSEL